MKFAFLYLCIASMACMLYSPHGAIQFSCSSQLHVACIHLYTLNLAINSSLRPCSQPAVDLSDGTLKSNC